MHSKSLSWATGSGVDWRIDNRFPWNYELRFPIWGRTDCGGEKEGQPAVNVMLVKPH